MSRDFDYNVRDSSIMPNISSMAASGVKDNAIRVGMVREQLITTSGPAIYVVEVLDKGKVLLIPCTVMTRFGGAHNYEEYAVRPWATVALPKVTPMDQGSYATRSGDMVVVTFINGQSKEGVILGGISHPGRKPVLTSNTVAYQSEFNGIHTSISLLGEYKRTFKGNPPINEVNLRKPSTGTTVLPPIPSPAGGSFYGFAVDGSYTVSDGRTQNIKIDKTGFAIKITSGGTSVTIGGDPVLGNFKVSTGSTEMSSVTTTKITSKLKMNLQSAQVSIKGLKVAIGNDQFELIDGLIKLIDALGSLTVTSPVGTCMPLMTAPTWAAQILPLKLKLTVLKGSL